MSDMKEPIIIIGAGSVLETRLMDFNMEHKDISLGAFQ
jgi:hypothetical protein